MSVGLSKIFQSFHGCFRTKTHHVQDKALFYQKGRFKSEKNRANCQSIADGLGELDHQSLNHLLTDSPWDHCNVFGQLSTSVNALMNDREPVAFLIEEVGFRKKGKFSARVGRQYLGSIGK